jgi:hypothetical protein
MNKFVNTESIFSTIGNYPVVDQFDILYTGLLSGSSYDNYVTGSLLSVKKFGQFYITVSGERGLAFSRLGTNQNLPDQKGANRTSYEYQPWRERAGNIRNLRIFSSSERYYDSLLPDFADFVKALNGFIYVNGSSLFVDITEIDPISRPPATPVGFSASFVFEPKFNNIRRMIKFNQSFYSNLNGLNSTVKMLASRHVIPYDAVEGSYWTDAAASLQTPMKEIDLSKLFFGFGEGVEQYKYPADPQPGEYYGSRHLPKPRKIITGGGVNWKIGPIIRGWKYGLIDGNPRYTNAVFRRDRYGQFRDMLEQRLYSVNIQDFSNAPQTSFNPEEGEPIPTKSSSSKLTLEYPVEVKFIKQTLINKKLQNVNVDPAATDSSNLSTYFTSSLPYFDGVIRNRGPLPPNVTSNAVTLTLNPDIFGNITI